MALTRFTAIIMTTATMMSGLVFMADTAAMADGPSPAAHARALVAEDESPTSDGQRVPDPGPPVRETGAPAQGPPPNWAPCRETTGARACFAPLGDVVWVKDTKGDGSHAAGFIRRADGKRFWCDNYLGSGNWAYCDWPQRIPEHSTVDLWAARLEGDHTRNESTEIEVWTT